MQSRWIEREAAELVERYARASVTRELALRVYTTRLLGGDPRLVLHGGGNTSVKIRMPDLLGQEVEVLRVKGSGWDMASIEPSGLPAVRLAPLQQLRARDALSDEDMVRIQRANLLDPMAPNPSVETLLHAFLPHKFVDHTHSTAVLSLVDQPDGAAISTEVYDGRMGVVPYLMPGFALAKQAAEVFDAAPRVEGLILLKHGIFTFGDTAREAYERMIEMVTLAEQRLERGRRSMFAARSLPQRAARLAEVAPMLRGACSLKSAAIEGAWQRQVMEFRAGPAVLNFVNGKELERYARAGVVTPDHTIRTKNWPLLLPPPEPEKLADFKQAADAAAAAFAEHYRLYFERNNARCGGSKRMLDPLPRVVLVPGLGLFGLGSGKKEARVAADLAEAAIETISGAESIGRFESIGEAEMFDCEYWSLEQAKLGKEPPKPLAGQVAVVTGAGGTIGAAIAKTFAAAGAEVALLDLEKSAAEQAMQAIGGAALALRCDVRDGASVRAAFDQVTEEFGGVDIAISNAGAAWQGRIGEVDEQVLRDSFELNFYGHQRV
ncbi:MAG TPA: bifunctional aldolase/short-chain dehydrogenase, partial [Pseudolabrys sp.]|nr:bifunctional aldolase/short-chain dehydrogenase [Pseudolabrys sp.]